MVLDSVQGPAGRRICGPFEPGSQGEVVAVPEANVTPSRSVVACRKVATDWVSARGRPSLSAAASKSCRLSRCARATNCRLRAAMDSAAVTTQKRPVSVALAPTSARTTNRDLASLGRRMHRGVLVVLHDVVELEREGRVRPEAGE